MADGFQPGTIVDDKYRVERVIGSGGMGVVFEATHLLLGQRVAIKRPRADLSGDPAARHLFLREARSSFQIRSRHVVRVLDLQVAADGVPYIVMEYLDGETLAHRISRGDMPAVSEALELMLQVLEGVAAVHRAGLVHRDLKPSNLYLATGDEHPIVKVLDLGIAKALTDVLGQAALGESERAGSVAYMSPEQLCGDGRSDHRSDLWSLGVVLFELLTGARPFAADTTAALVSQILVDPPAQLRPLCQDVPAALKSLVFKCLEKDSGRRFQDVSELERAMVNVHQMVKSDRPTGSSPSMPPGDPTNGETTCALPVPPRTRPGSVDYRLARNAGGATLLLLVGCGLHIWRGLDARGDTIDGMAGPLSGPKPAAEVSASGAEPAVFAEPARPRTFSAPTLLPSPPLLESVARQGLGDAVGAGAMAKPPTAGNAAEGFVSRPSAIPRDAKARQRTAVTPDEPPAIERPTDEALAIDTRL